MKKIVTLLIVVMVFSLVACGTNEDNGKKVRETDTDTVEVLDTDWTKGEIQFDGKLLKFPFKFSELEAMGWTIKEVPDGVESWEWPPLMLENSNYDSDKVLVFAILDATEECDISDYMVSGLEIMMWSVEENDPKPFVAVNGVTYGDSKEKVEECMGKIQSNPQGNKQYIYSYTHFSEESGLTTVFFGIKEDNIVKAIGMHYNGTE